MTQDVHLDPHLPSLSTANPTVPWPLASVSVITTKQDTIISGSLLSCTSELSLLALELCSLSLSLYPS